MTLVISDADLDRGVESPLVQLLQFSAEQWKSGLGVVNSARAAREHAAILGLNGKKIRLEFPDGDFEL